MDHHHSYATRIRHNITIKPAARRRNSTDAQLSHPPTPDQYPEFPPPHVVLHPDDANSKVFLAVARAFISVVRASRFLTRVHCLYASRITVL